MPHAPRVLNKRHGATEGVYIGRPTKWGNPFEIGRDGNRDEVIARYKSMLQANPELREAARQELAGKNLICWCKPYACHGDILLEVANSNPGEIKWLQQPRTTSKTTVPLKVP